MKKIITLLFLMSLTISNIYSQTPPNKKAVQKRSVSSVNKAKIIEKERETNYSKETKKEVNYIEIKVEKYKGKTIVNIPKEAIKSEYTSKSAQIKMKYLQDLDEKLMKTGISVVNEMGKLGFILSSHSFAFNKDKEIHYYIFEF